MTNQKNVSAAGTCRTWYDHSYGEMLFAAQRLYPNEELCRFLGRQYISRVAPKQRSHIRILELGCGSCSNLWMIAREGFDAYGIDLSSKAIELGYQMLSHWNVSARLAVGSMTELPFRSGYFDSVVDVFSSNCLELNDFKRCLREAHRVLKTGGRFFSYTPSAHSDAFKVFKPARKLDAWTLDGIRRKTSPFYGNFYPFRFMRPSHLRRVLEQQGFAVDYLETVGRTYRGNREYFEFVTISGVKE